MTLREKLNMHVGAIDSVRLFTPTEHDRLLLALDTLEAVDWIEATDQQVWRSPLRHSNALYKWLARDHSNTKGEADTLPEAVRALREKLEVKP